MAQDFLNRIKINNISIDEDGVVIKTMIIKDWFFDMIPRIELILNDARDVLFNYMPIQDDFEIEIEINKNSNFDKQNDPLVLKLSVLDWESIPLVLGNEEGHVHSITAYLKVDNLFYPTITTSYKNKSSVGVLESVSNELGLSFNNRLSDNSKDNMNWLQVGQNYHDMIRYVNQHSYISDDDTTLVYINLDGELVYTSLKNETEKEIAFIGKLSPEKQSEEKESNFDDVKEQTGDNKDKPIFYYSVATNKTFGSRNKMLTYETKVTQYNGSVDYQTSINGLGDKFLNSVSQRNKNNVDKDVAQFEYGILNGGDNFSEGVHKDFFTSEVRHKYTLMNFFKNQLHVKVKGNNLIKKYDVVQIEMKDPVEQQINEAHSGKYIVGGIIHTLGEETEYSVELILYRSGINKPSFDDENLVVE